MHIMLLLTLNRLQSGVISNCKICEKRQDHHASFCHAVLLSLTLVLNSEYHPR